MSVGPVTVIVRPAIATAPPDLRRSAGHQAVAFALLCLGCFIAYLDIQIVSASIQEIGGGLSATQDELGWIQSSYLIAEIVVIPLSAWLSQVMSTRWLVAASAAGFTLASVLCSTAWDIRSMIVFRALQGLCGGSLIPTAFTAAVILFEGKQKAIAASFVSATAGLAPTLGPVIGGRLTDCHGTGCSTSTSCRARSSRFWFRSW
jgi:MFS transporter, DHA2 family, multidrug resistance protein